MVQVKSDRLLELIGCGSGHGDDYSETKIVDRCFSRLQDYRFLACPGRADMGNQRFRVVEVQSRNGLACAHCRIEQGTTGTKLRHRESLLACEAVCAYA